MIKLINNSVFNREFHLNKICFIQTKNFIEYAQFLNAWNFTKGIVKSENIFT